MVLPRRAGPRAALSVMAVYVLTMHLFVLALLQGLHLGPALGHGAETLAAAELCLSSDPGSTGERSDLPASGACEHWCCASPLRSAPAAILTLIDLAPFRIDTQEPFARPEVVRAGYPFFPGSPGRPRAPPATLA